MLGVMQAICSEPWRVRIVFRYDFKLADEPLRTLSSDWEHFAGLETT